MEPSKPGRITAIEPQAKRPERVSIFVDGEFALGVHGEAAAAAGLRVGQPVDPERLGLLAGEEETRAARESALRLLGHRAHSRTELERRLERKGYEPARIREALDALARSGLIDDAEFSRSWVLARSGSRPMGRSRIAAELRQRGVERELIDEALEARDPETELELALSVARQRAAQLRGEDPRSARRKLAAALARRGYSWETAARALDLLFGEDESP